GIDQGPGKRAVQNNALLADYPPDEEGIAVSRRNEDTGTVVEIPHVGAGLGQISKRLQRKVGALQVFCPLAIELVGPIVDDLQPVNPGGLELVSNQDDEIDVAVVVEVPEGECALEIESDEGVWERVLNPRYQGSQDLVKLGKTRWMHRPARP